MPTKVKEAKKKNIMTVRGSQTMWETLTSEPKPPLRLPESPVKNLTDVPSAFVTSKESSCCERGEVKRETEVRDRVYYAFERVK